MDVKTRLDIARNILNNATKMNMSGDLLLKISRKIDRYVMEYYSESREKKGGAREEANV
ncbi:MAG: Spo0E family sporulation regulatory protein-aspartic acid phosphatase [Tepidanaerobacteraceae bacterium]|jgi:hypothetical protein|nr:Spo0E family sporulation regulatory protein-aspartic acid phosphatase [Tepidanaerobacteraceae bacterium]